MLLPQLKGLLRRRTVACFSCWAFLSYPLFSSLSVSVKAFSMAGSSLKRIRTILDAKKAPASSTKPSPATRKAKRRRSSTSPTVVTPPTAPGQGILTSEMVAMVNPEEPFQELVGATPAELRPSATLTTGQCFHWRVVKTAVEAVGGKKESAWGSHNATEWVGVLRLPSGNSVAIVLRETPSSTLYRVLKAPPNDVDIASFLHGYFQLDEPLVDLYEQWSKRCPRLDTIAACIRGVRIVDQDPWECLVSFLCSSNNNIPRITKMLSAIRREYGEPLITIADEVFYSFPSLEVLMDKATDSDLRSKCGMGYRAKYLMETMKILDSLGGECYLQELRTIKDPTVVQNKLIQFCGVGRKVADCVALFSLKQSDAIPVDVHVWNIARRDYDQDGTLESMKSLTPTNYNCVGDLFRDRFLVKSGWAHSLLFVAELPSFRPVLPEELVIEMDKVSYAVAS